MATHDQSELLSRILAQIGFVCVLNTFENVAGMKRLVEAGKPQTTGTNMGIRVVYDEHGWPWVRRARDMNAGAEDALRAYEHRVGAKLERGCRVPHSNDGGFFAGQYASPHPVKK